MPIRPFIVPFTQSHPNLNNAQSAGHCVRKDCEEYDGEGKARPCRFCRLKENKCTIEQCLFLQHKQLHTAIIFRL
ncbi:hypothetical protein FKM82_001966 [Ascaphus truei]